MLGITNDYVAWCLDEAVTHLGVTIDSDIERATEKAKNEKVAKARAQATLNKWLMPAGAKKQFADPAAVGKRIKKREEVQQ